MIIHRTLKLPAIVRVLAASAGLAVFLSSATRGEPVETIAMQAAPPAASPTVLVPIQSSWRYWKGTAEASNPASLWRTVAFNDTSWTEGVAPFHYGENINGGTLLSDMQNRYSSVFLRKSFTVTDAAGVGELRLMARCDDGFIAWINGIEVVRYNVPAGSRAFNTFASAAAAEPVAEISHPLPAPAYLQTGANVIAVQVFNASLSSSDLLWDGQLITFAPDRSPPQVVSVHPAAGVMESLEEVSVTFNEPVTGVRAEDLYLGNAPAISVTGFGPVYTFRFARPPPGPVELRWDADASIFDLATPPNLFDPVPAGTWQYTLVDRTSPTLVEIAPRPGLTVRRLAQIELRFSEPVEGVDASDLLLNGEPAMSVTGALAGPYRFEFAPAERGEVKFTWSSTHGITDQAEPPNSFTAVEWSLRVDPDFPVPALRINEFLASNTAATGLKDEDGELQDWIEIFNAGSVPASLDGWSLTDSANDPHRWVFPAVTLAPGAYLLVFASGKDRKPATPGGRLHTNFKLSPAGEYLALLNPESPRVIVSEFKGGYPEQRNDYSYGYDPDGELRYFRTPTPGFPNGRSSIEGIVPPPHVNVPRGWFDAPIVLHVSSQLPGVTFRYTTDGSEPTESNGQLYTAPLRIATTTVLRVAGFKPGLLPSVSVTHTYLFAEQILRQPNNPPGYPATWGTHGNNNQYFPGNRVPADYEMDPEIVNDPAYRDLMRQSLLALPTMSLVCRVEDMFGAAGIYSFPLSRGPAWERPCSLEFIPLDGSDGFQVNAGVQVQGNAAREPQKQPKHPFRITFKSDYGPTRLDYRMFPDSPVRSFDTLILRADFNFSWLHWNPSQRQAGQRTRDAWMKDTMRAMGGLASHNRYVHLFINGLYWGVYDPTERPDGSFGEAYLGGEKEDYDVINEGAVVDGTRAAYDEMLALSNLASPAAYDRMRQLLDLPQFIDYMLLHFYVAHQDWGQNKNWYTLRPKDGRRGFLYVPWDGEMILDQLNHNRVNNVDVPSGLHTKLLDNPEYRLAFADRARRHLFHDGALTPAAVAARWMTRAREVELPMVAESARWGDYRRDVHPYQNPPYPLYTRDNQWRAEQNRLLNTYFPQRTAILLGQLRAAGLYPTVDAPELNRSGGRVERGFQVEMSGADGTVYFTTDGSDPRVALSGAVAGSARPYRVPISLEQSLRLKARTLRQGVWSALTEVDFQVADVPLSLRFTEIMYHPPGGDAFEFVELRHLGPVSLDVTGYSFGGIQYIFPPGTIVRPGQLLVLASRLSPTSFAARYPDVSVFGYFDGALSNSGERLELRDRDGRPVTALRYADRAPWPAGADGSGYSLEAIEAEGDPRDPANWRSSAIFYGTPERHELSTSTPLVRINEVFASQLPGQTGDLSTDWIELFNAGASPVSLAGWTLTKHGSSSFIFPAEASLAAGAYAMVWCDGEPAGAGFRAPFRLAREREIIGLYDAAGARVDIVSYGPQAPGFSIGRAGPASKWTLNRPTPAEPNSVAELAAPASLRLNEWLANARPGEADWLELYNSDPARPAALSGLVFVTPQARFQLQSLSFIPPGGFIQLFADEGEGPDHLDFKLPATGGFIELLDATGASVDAIVYGPQMEGVSEGRLPDGAARVTSFPVAPSPGLSNGSADDPAIVFTEILAHDGHGAGWVELTSHAVATLDLTGWEIVFERSQARRWSFPRGTMLPPLATRTLWFDPARPASLQAGLDLNTGLALDVRGGSLHLRSPSGRVVDAVDFGFQIPGLSIGPASGGWTLLSVPTPGEPNAVPATLGPTTALRLNEWLAWPATGDDWLELFNSGERPVSLTGLCLTDTPTVDARCRFTVGPASFIAPGGWVAFEADGNPRLGPDHLNFGLNALGESLQISTPGGLLIDEAFFGWQERGRSEGRLPDGGPGIGPLAAGPTRSASNTIPPAAPDTDGDGLPDDWELAFGTNPNVPDAGEDPDADGLTNAQEYLAGTHPNDAASTLGFLSVTRSGTGIVLAFPAAAGRNYRVLYRDRLGGSDWIELADIPAQPVAGMRTVMDLEAGVESRFYRLIIPAWP